MLRQYIANLPASLNFERPPTHTGGIGLTAVVYVDREPWNKWGPHLASFGFQANAVAGSPYYRLLCGLLLGYK